jgi:hypothetical protein
MIGRLLSNKEVVVHLLVVQQIYGAVKHVTNHNASEHDIGDLVRSRIYSGIGLANVVEWCIMD